MTKWTALVFAMVCGLTVIGCEKKLPDPCRPGNMVSSRLKNSDYVFEQHTWRTAEAAAEGRSYWCMNSKEIEELGDTTWQAEELREQWQAEALEGR